jgi:HSP20 family molecular chaperone IbpA
MYNPIKYFTDEFVKNMQEGVKEVISFTLPPVTMYEDGSEVVIEADLAGFNKKDITVKLEKDSLIISAERKVEKKGIVHLDQRPDKVFKRIKLPFEVEPNSEYKAKFNNGVLSLRIPEKGAHTITIE